MFITFTGSSTFSLPLFFSSKSVLSVPLHCCRRSPDFCQRKETNFIGVHLILLQDDLFFPPCSLVHNLVELAGPEQCVMLQISTESCRPSSLPEHCMKLMQLSQEEQSALLHQGYNVKISHSVLAGKSSFLLCGKISRTYK